MSQPASYYLAPSALRHLKHSLVHLRAKRGFAAILCEIGGAFLLIKDAPEIEEFCQRLSAVTRTENRSATTKIAENFFHVQITPRWPSSSCIIWTITNRRLLYVKKGRFCGDIVHESRAPHVLPSSTVKTLTAKCSPKCSISSFADGFTCGYNVSNYLKIKPPICRKPRQYSERTFMGMPDCAASGPNM